MSVALIAALVLPIGGSRVLAAPPVGLACTITGTEGPDEIFGTPGDDVICALGGNDGIIALGGDDVLRGGGGNDTLLGGTGDDRLEGGDGTDVLAGGAGSDVLSGGPGPLDAASYVQLPGPVTVDLAPADSIEDGVTYSHGNGAVGENDRIGHDIERLVGGDGDDVLNGSDRVETFEAGAGADQLDGRGGGDLLAGGTGNDTIVGNSGNDVLAGGTGNDTIDGNAGNDVVVAAAGADGDDVMTGGPGIDQVDYSFRTTAVRIDLSQPDGDQGTYNPVTGAAVERDRVREFERARGGSAGDLLLGSAGDDVLLGENGDDTIDPRGGTDIVDAGDGADFVDSRDTVFDDIDCGPGVDAYRSDAADLVVNCEGVVLPETDLSIALVDDPDPVAAEELLTYTATVTNLGAETETAAQVSVDLPDGLTDLAVVSGTCASQLGGDFVCSLPSLAAGASATVSVRGRPAQVGQITATATITGRASTTDPVGANDVATATTTVEGRVTNLVVSINSVSVLEGDPPTLSPAVFTVTLSAPSTDTVSVNYATAPGTATSPADYVQVGGTVTFNPGDTSEQVTVQVKGDLLDEPDETYFVNLSAATNALIGDGQGEGTIRDDERDGKFSCRATGLRLLGLEVGVANGPNSPCVDDARTTLNANLSVLGIGVNSGTVQVSTDQTPNDLEATWPAVGDKGVANAEVQGLTIRLGLTTVTADLITSTAKVECGSPLMSTPRLTGSSRVSNVRVNGRLVANGTAAANITLPLLGILRINHQTVVGGVVTQRAIWLEGNGLMFFAQVVVSEAKANFSGNPCGS